MEIIGRVPTKINPGLDVLYKCVGSYHETEPIPVSVDLVDHLTFENLEEDIIRIETDSSFLPVNRRGHVHQTADLLRRAYNIHRGIRIYVEEHIPMAIGLAGGSSNCAATLRGLSKLQNLGLMMDELCKIGSQIGIDIPYCLRDGTAFANERGKKIGALPTMSRCWIVLAKPRTSVFASTISNDLAVDELHHPDIAGLRIVIENGDYTRMIQTVDDTSESVTTTRHPVVQQVKDRVLRYSVDVTLMSDSRPTVFILCEEKTRAQRIYNELKGFCEEVYLVRTLKQIKIIERGARTQSDSCPTLCCLLSLFLDIP